MHINRLNINTAYGSCAETYARHSRITARQHILERLNQTPDKHKKQRQQRLLSGAQEEQPAAGPAPMKPRSLTTAPPPILPVSSMPMMAEPSA